LDIKLATVKSHVSHILQKLGVNRRSEAKTAAEQPAIITAAIHELIFFNASLLSIIILRFNNDLSYCRFLL